MKSSYLILSVCLLTLASCHKGTTDRPQPPAPPPPPGTPAVLGLKDLNERNLPSPYYHFDYNDSGLIARASHTSGLYSYNIEYSGKEILTMKNKGGNRDVLHYEYADGKPSAIKIANDKGVVYRQVSLHYNAFKQLSVVLWEVLVNGGFSSERSQEFSYYPNGNLSRLIEHYEHVGSQLESWATDNFEDYDDNVNTDGFTLLKPQQLMHLLVLPGVQLQLNNPRRVIHTGDGPNYAIDYTYICDPVGRPMVKNGDLLWTSGPDSGKHFATQSTYSYYN